MFVIVILFIEVLWIKFVYFDICCMLYVVYVEYVLVFLICYLCLYMNMCFCLIMNLIFRGDFLLVYSFFFLGIDLFELII